MGRQGKTQCTPALGALSWLTFVLSAACGAPAPAAPASLPPSEAPNDVAPNDVAPNDVAPNDVAPNDVAPNDVAPNDVAPNDVAPSQAPSGAAGQVSSGPPGDVELHLEAKNEATKPTTDAPRARQALMQRLDARPLTREARVVPRSCDEPANAGAPSKIESCYPPAAFVEALCRASYPGVALVMFDKSSPWRRGYLRGETKAWSTAPTAQQNDRLAQDEEVIVLQRDASAGSDVQYDAGASFYALRWDGSCVKLTEEELAVHVPWAKKTPVLQWSYIDDEQKALLRRDVKIDAAHQHQRKQCRAGRNEQECQASKKRLSDLIVAYVRQAGGLPDPTHRP